MCHCTFSIAYFVDSHHTTSFRLRLLLLFMCCNMPITSTSHSTHKHATNFKLFTECPTCRLPVVYTKVHHSMWNFARKKNMLKIAVDTPNHLQFVPTKLKLKLQIIIFCFIVPLRTNWNVFFSFLHRYSSSVHNRKTFLLYYFLL